MSNPENGIYLGNLNKDFDLVFFNEFNTFGIFYTWKPVTSTSEPWPHKLLVETSIPCKHPRTWSKYSKETEKIIDLLAKEGYDIGFESHIRDAIIEILDSIRDVKEEMLRRKADSPMLYHIKNWKPCQKCDCYHCYKQGLCGSGCSNNNKVCVNNLWEEVL